MYVVDSLFLSARYQKYIIHDYYICDSNNIAVYVYTLVCPSHSDIEQSIHEYEYLLVDIKHTLN